VKSADGRCVAIKASGTTLAQMSETADWVELDIAKILLIFDRAQLACLPVNVSAFINTAPALEPYSVNGWPARPKSSSKRY